MSAAFSSPVAVASARQVLQTLDSAIIAECVKLWVETYRWLTRPETEKNPDGNQSCDVEPVDEYLARHGIHFPTERHTTPSLYRRYEMEVVRQARKLVEPPKAPATPKAPVTPAKHDPVTGRRLSTVTPDDRAEMVEMYAHGLSMGDIATLTGRSTGLVCHELKRAGVKARRKRDYYERSA